MTLKDNFENVDPDFRKIVDECARKELNHPIFNSAMSHATYLLYKLLEIAAEKKREIWLISGKLDRQAYNQSKVLETLDACIESDVKMHVIVCDGVDEDRQNENKFHKKLQNKSNVKLYMPSKGAGRLPHMLLIGDQSFRFETDTDTQQARANFNSPSTVSMLREIFNDFVAERQVVPSNN